jgi:hypothetical protein
MLPLRPVKAIQPTTTAAIVINGQPAGSGIASGRLSRVTT